MDKERCRSIDLDFRRMMMMIYSVRIEPEQALSWVGGTRFAGDANLPYIEVTMRSASYTE